MEDLIKRSDAIKAIVNTPSNIADVMGNNLCLDGAVFRQNEIIDILKDIPSAEEQGEWERIPYSMTDYGRRCSLCHFKVGNPTNFCPNCGCRMKGADDESLL